MSDKIKGLYHRCYEKKLITKDTLEEIYDKKEPEIKVKKILQTLEDNQHFDLKSSTMRDSLAKEIARLLN